jgi:hypothetical protein
MVAMPRTSMEELLRVLPEVVRVKGDIVKGDVVVKGDVGSKALSGISGTLGTRGTPPTN